MPQTKTRFTCFFAASGRIYFKPFQFPTVKTIPKRRDEIGRRYFRRVKTLRYEIGRRYATS